MGQLTDLYKMLKTITNNVKIAQFSAYFVQVQSKKMKSIIIYTHTYIIKHLKFTIINMMITITIMRLTMTMLVFKSLILSYNNCNRE